MQKSPFACAAIMLLLSHANAESSIIGNWCQTSPVRDARQPLPLHITSATQRAVKGSEQLCRGQSGVSPQRHAEARVFRTRTYLLMTDGKRRYWLRFKTPEALKGEIISFDAAGSSCPDD
jgi:hypothetical protein